MNENTKMKVGEMLADGFEEEGLLVKRFSSFRLLYVQNKKFKEINSWSSDSSFEKRICSTLCMCVVGNLLLVTKEMKNSGKKIGVFQRMKRPSDNKDISLVLYLVAWYQQVRRPRAPGHRVGESWGRFFKDH